MMTDYETAGVGDVFGLLRVKEITETGVRLCVCECGRVVRSTSNALVSGKRTSCDICKNGTCRYNKGVICYGFSKEKCAFCGWSPFVERARKKEMKGKMGNENEHSHRERSDNPSAGT